MLAVETATVVAVFTQDYLPLLLGHLLGTAANDPSVFTNTFKRHY